MEYLGLEPKLQITPIALQISTLGKKIDAKRAKLKISPSDTFVWEDIKDEDLLYAPTSIKAINGYEGIEIEGGKTKSQWIKDNKGFLIDIVPTKENLEADPKIQKDQAGQINHDALQADQYATKSYQSA